MAKAQRNGMELTYEQAFEEVVADSMEAMLADGKVMDKLAKLKAQDQSLWEKLKEAITELANKIRELYASLKPDSKEGQYVAQMKDAIEKIQELFTDALIDASENYQAANGQKNAAQQDGTRNSLRDNEIQAIQNIGRKSVNDFTSQDIKATEVFAKKYFQEMGVKSPFFRAWFGDWRAYGTKNVIVSQATRSASYKAGKATNQDTGRLMSWGSDFIRETVKHQRSGGIAGAIVGNIGKIVENAVLLDSFVSTPSSKTKMPGTVFMHSFYALVNDGNVLAMVKLYAEEAVSLKTGEPFTRAYDLKDIAIVAISANGVHPKSGSLTDADIATINSVADLFSAVKRKDGDFSPKSVNPALLNEDGTPKVFYHGTPNGDFTVFHNWQYFSDIKEYADVYQNQGASSNGYKNTARNKKTYETYLAPKNIFDTRNPANKKIFQDEFYGKWGNGTPLSEKGLPDWTDGDDLVEFFEENGYDYDAILLDEGATGGYGETVKSRGISIVVRDATAIKSATDNVGTFNRNNPDIRYSTRDPELQKANAVLEKENSQLREDVKELRALLKLQRQVTNGTKFTKSSVEAAARYLKSAVNAKGDTREFAGLLNEFYEYIASGGEITWETVSDMAQPAIQWLHEHQKQERNDYAQDILKQIRGTKVYLVQQQKQEAAYAYGSYNDFRKSLMGTITLSDSANMSLDSAWHEWSQEYPYLFKEDISASDMPVAFAEAISTLRSMSAESAYDSMFTEQELLRVMYYYKNWTPHFVKSSLILLNRTA